MRIPNTSLRLLPLLAAYAVGHAAADEQKLAGGEDRLSGVVRSISPEGAVELASELSSKPLLLKSGAVKKIEILEYDDSHKRHRSEERGDPAHDRLISSEDDRWTGRLLGIRNTKDGARFVFKTGFSEKPVEVPAADVSTVFLSGDTSEKADDGKLPFVLRLPGEGSLGVSSWVFTGDSATAVHPVLGPLSFRRSGIQSIEWIPSAAGTSPKP